MTNKSVTIANQQRTAIDRRLKALDPDKSAWPTQDQIQAVVDGLLDAAVLVVLIIDHKYGQDISIHATEDSARKSLYEWASQWWDELNGVDDISEFTQQQAVDCYFENHGRESYAIDVGVEFHP